MLSCYLSCLNNVNYLFSQQWTQSEALLPWEKLIQGLMIYGQQCPRSQSSEIVLQRCSLNTPLILWGWFVKGVRFSLCQEKLLFNLITQLFADELQKHTKNEPTPLGMQEGSICGKSLILIKKIHYIQIRHP